MPVTALATLTIVAALSNADSLFSEANRAYEAGQYEAAAATYEEIRQSGLECPELYFNLGNAYYRQGELGRAILSFRRCLKLAPRDREARRNLELTRARVGDQPRPPLVTRIATSVVETFSSRELTRAVLVLCWAAGILGFCHVVGRSRWSRVALITVLAVAVPCLLLWWSRLSFEKQPLAVLIETAAARSGPGDDYQLQFTAGEGTEVMEERREHGWHLVRVPQGHRGWVKAEKLERW
jgi:tetratricopeptide (TPR) repeat protein